MFGFNDMEKFDEYLWLTLAFELAAATNIYTPSSLSPVTKSIIPNVGMDHHIERSPDTQLIFFDRCRFFFLQK